MILQSKRSLASLTPQEEVLLVSKGNQLIASFGTEEEAKAWLEKRSKQPGTHPTVRMVKRTITFQELEAA